jgi:hypothetical protein
VAGSGIVAVVVTSVSGTENGSGTVAVVPIDRKFNSGSNDVSLKIQLSILISPHSSK